MFLAARYEKSLQMQTKKGVITHNSLKESQNLEIGNLELELEFWMMELGKLLLESFRRYYTFRITFLFVFTILRVN